MATFASLQYDKAETIQIKATASGLAESGQTGNIVVAAAQPLFGAATNLALGNPPQSVVVGDFDRDGKPDLAVANVGSDNVSLLLGDGVGGFGSATNFAVGDGPVSFAAHDFDRDGDLDLAVANNGSNNVSVLLGN